MAEPGLHPAAGYRVAPRIGGGIVLTEPNGQRIEFAARWSETLLPALDRIAGPSARAVFIAGWLVAASAVIDAARELIDGRSEPRAPSRAPDPKGAA